ncbi:DUF5711 family protein [Eubacteriales bacterium OttesenSCG-928-K08]|nr:DUF5711 family protein [Eubacteriales bacterium OttesenSCG-928-K08]
MEKRKRKVKNKRKTIMRLSLVIIGLLALVALGVLGALTIIKNRSVAQATLVEQSFNSSDQYVYTGTGFFYLQGDTLTYEDKANSRNNYKGQITTQAVSLLGSADMLVIYNDISIKVIGEEFPVEFSGALRSVTCGNGYIAALRADTNGNETILVIDSTGAKYDEIPVQNQYIVSYGFFSADGEYLYVLGLTLDSSTPLSTITVYNISRKTTSGMMSVQSQLVESMRFSKSSIYAVGTNSIIRFSLADNNESYRATVYGWRELDYDSSTANPSFLLCPRSSSALNTVKILQLSDTKVATSTEKMLQLPSGTKEAFLMNGRLVAVSELGYTVYDYAGKKLSYVEFPSMIDSVEKLDGTQLLITAGNHVYTTKV